MKRRDFFQKTQKKRYANQTFRNPYFQETPHKKSLFFLSKILVVVVCLGVVAFTLLLHPRFQIQKSEVEGIQHVTYDQVNQSIESYLSERVFFFFTRRSQFLFQPTVLADLLQKNFAFTDLTVERKGTDLKIKLTERTSHLIWQTVEKKYIVDLEGVIIRDATDQDVLPLFVDRQNIPTSIGRSVLTANEIKSVFQFQERLTQQNISFTQTQFDRLAGKWTGILTVDGYTILFDATGDIDAQADRLAILRSQKIKDPSKLQYIDLRFGDHVYVK